MANHRKLTIEIATSIRHLYKDLEYTIPKLSYIFNVSISVVHKIIRNTMYGDADYNPGYIPTTPLFKYYNNHIHDHYLYHNLKYEDCVRPIKDFSHYVIVIDGTIFSDFGLHYTKVMPYIDTNQYLSVKLHHNTARINKRIHVLIAEHFLTNDNNLPCVLHKDDDKLNNTLDNLYFGDYKDNHNDMVKNGKYIYRIPECCKKGIKALIDSDPIISNGTIAKRIGITMDSVKRIRKELAETNNNN